MHRIVSQFGTVTKGKALVEVFSSVYHDAIEYPMTLGRAHIRLPLTHEPPNPGEAIQLILHNAIESPVIPGRAHIQFCLIHEPPNPGEAIRSTCRNAHNAIESPMTLGRAHVQF